MSSNSLSAVLSGDPRRLIFASKIAAGVLAGVAALSCAPFMLLRLGEFHVYAQYQPLRCLLEVVGSTALIGSVVAQGFGATCPAFVTSVIKRYVPGQVLRALPIVPPQVSIGLRLIAGSLLLYSLMRGMDPQPKELMNMQGKTVLLTGGTSGIGFATAKALARRGAHIILLVRNKLKGDYHAKLLRDDAGESTRVTVLVADQEDLQAVAGLAAQISAAAPNGIDSLVLNAGLAPSNPLVKSVSGYESTFTVMHLSHFLLTKLVWKILNKDARVVITSSVGHAHCSDLEELFGAVSDVDDGSKVSRSPHKAYTRAKLANALFARQLGRLADSDPRRIRVSSHHPGAVATSIWTGSVVQKSLIVRFFDLMADLFMRTNEAGAATLIDAVAGVNPLYRQLEAPNGSYYCSSLLVDGGFCFNPLLNSQEAAAEFWQKTEDLIAPFAPVTASWN